MFTHKSNTLKVTDAFNALKALAPEKEAGSDLSKLSKQVESIIQKLFKSSKTIERDLLNLNDFKTLTLKLLLNEELTCNSNLIFLNFIKVYYSTVSIDKIIESNNLADYLFQLCNQFFETKDLSLIYSSEVTIDLFNNLLSLYSQHASDLIPQTLAATTLQYKQQTKSKDLNFLQALTVSVLTTARMTSEIALLYDEAELMEFDTIDKNNLGKQEILVYFVQLVKALRSVSRFEDAQDLLQIIFKIPITLKGKTIIDELTAILTINSMQIDDPTKPELVNLVKYKNFIPAIYLKIYQSYQLNDINQFFKYAYVEYSNNSIDGLISLSVLKQLLVNITSKRLNYLKSKFISITDDALLKEFDWISVNSALLDSIGLQFNPEDFELPTYNSSYTCADLSLVNMKLNEIVIAKTTERPTSGGTGSKSAKGTKAN